MSCMIKISRGGLALPQGRDQPRFGAGSMPFEVLHRALVLLRRGARFESSKIPALARFRIDFAGIEPVFAGLQFSDHGRHRVFVSPFTNSAAGPLVPAGLFALSPV